MNKRNRIIYYIVTGLFSLMLGAGGVTYLIQPDEVGEVFAGLGISPALVYPLAIAKLLGVAAFWVFKKHLLKDLAYLGFALDLVAAMVVHLMAGDGEFYGPIIPLVLLIASFALYRKIYAPANAA